MATSNGLPPWKEIVRQRRAKQLEQIPTAWRLSDAQKTSSKNVREIIHSCGILSSQELELTDMTDVRPLLKKLATGEVSSLLVTTAFCKRAAIAQQVTKCLTEIFFDQALKRANELDSLLMNGKKTTGPLHGLPVSIKDRFDVEGLDTTVGWVGLVGKPAKTSAAIVQRLLDMGAVIYVKTNIPQSLMMSDSYNHVFGQSVNAFNVDLISGGSSGGEGALVASGGSILGIGTDIGGSIRIPADVQGLYGLAPTTGRVPWDSSFAHQRYLVTPVAGPMTTSLSSLEYFMESLLDSEPWNHDYYTVPIPWRRDIARIPDRPLRVAFLYDDGVVRPQPPIARALREVAAKLRAAGHEVLQWDHSLHVEGTELWMKGVLADGGEYFKAYSNLTGEPIIEGMVVGTAKDKLGPYEREEYDRTKRAFQNKFLKQWTTSGIDALIMPVLSWVGYKPKTWVRSHQWLGYTALWNLLDYSGLTFPVTRADPNLDTPDQDWSNHSPRNESDKFNHEQYDIDLVKGMPVCVQIVGGRFGEEKTVAVAKVLDQLLGHDKSPFHSDP